MNEGFSNLTGYTRNKVIGKSSYEIIIWKNIEERNRLKFHIAVLRVKRVPG
ncbi:MAG: hypothetical protein ACYDA4_12245 [Ignavibacteriaceae bacterium]